MRKAIAKRVVQSYSTIPHYYVSNRSCVDEINKLRLSVKANTDEKITITDILIKVMSLACLEFPMVNSQWSGEAIFVQKSVDVSVAVSTENGLFTPVVRNCQVKSIKQISQELKALIKKAHENSLSPEDYQGGTISISNLGMLDVSNFEAIINPPQVIFL